MGLRGIGPALAGNVGTGGAFALSREGGSGCRRSNARSGPIPLPPVRAWWVAICWSFGIGRLGLRFVDGLRFLGGVVLRVWRWGWVAGGGSAGSVLRSQGTLGQEERSRCRARGDQGVDVPMLAPARSRCRRKPSDSLSETGEIWVADQRGAWATENLEPRATGRGWLKHDLIHR